MLKRLTALFFLISINTSAQVVGKITDTQGNPLPFVTIFLEDSYTGTASNEDGDYSLNLPKTPEKATITIGFKALGYKTIFENVPSSSLPFSLNVVLQEEATDLGEVVLGLREDPAYDIIRKTISRQKVNLEKLSEYTADFYSRGTLRMANVPEKILGREVGDFEGALDSTRNGAIYISETISKIAFQKPDNFSERIVASNEIGNDNGFYFNNAQSVNYSFYENTVAIRVALVSPIAKNALHYYHYRLDGTFHDGSQIGRASCRERV